ncbi:hypothetical protein KR032_007468 [Drosophila birchii]|nr:hypothetical protein KR032_007468 [Drosophila birchii]
MSRSFKVGQLGVACCWRVGSIHRDVARASNLRSLQKRYYAGRYTFDDVTQSHINALYNTPSDADIPRENPWRGNFPNNLNDMGYESHCNDRLYMAKNNYRHNQQTYEQKRQERRMEAQKRMETHFNTNDDDNAQTEMWKRVVMEDPDKHRKRQQDIIEKNRRLWQSRPQVKREINLSGITYRPNPPKQLKNQKSKDSDNQDDYMRYRPKSDGETEAEAETNYWIRKQMERAERETAPEAERSGWHTNRPMAEAEAETEAEGEDHWWLKKPIGSPLQRRLQELMEAEQKPEAEECDWRVKSPRAEAEECDWRVKSPRTNSRNPEAEECDWRVKSPKAEAEECDWRVKSPMGRNEPDWRTNSRNPEAEECDWRVKSPKAEAEECDWRVKSPSGRNEPDWRTNSRNPEAEECDWRVKSPKAEAEECDWRVKSPRGRNEPDWRTNSRNPEAEECDWRVKSPRAEAEECDWRYKGRPMRSQSADYSLQKRLTKLMEAERRPSVEEAEWQTQDPKAEAEGSPKMDAEMKAEDKAWKARNLSAIYDPNQTSTSWQEKQDQAAESQYWHSWHTCPDNQDLETNVEVKPHQRRKKFTVHPPMYTRGGQRRSYHQTALNPQPLEKESESEPLANAPLMPKPLRAVPKKQKKAKPKRKRERRSVEPPRFKMTIKTLPLANRRSAPSLRRRHEVLAKVVGPSFHMDNLKNSLVDVCVQAKNNLVNEN